MKMVHINAGLGLRIRRGFDFGMLAGSSFLIPKFIRDQILLIPFLLLSMIGVGCSDAPKIEGKVNPDSIQFSGDQALEYVTDFVSRFPNRDSGKPNNKKAAIWLESEFKRLGLSTTMDHWDIVNYSKDVPMQNVVGKIHGESEKEIIIVAHFDQSPYTYEGADNDGSGMAVLMQLAEIFSQENKPKYTLVFLAADGEEYGMLGTLQYVQTHPNADQSIAGLSLDNVGKKLYNGLRMDPRGQFRGYGALWFQLLAQKAAQSIADDWVPLMNPVVIQLLDQAVPVSFMDEGPLVAAGIPSFGLAGATPPEFAQLHWDTYHSPKDLVKYQSAETLGHTGRISEAIIRQCLAMDEFPDESGPYLFFRQSGKVLRGFPLWMIFVFITCCFFLVAFLLGRKNGQYFVMKWQGPLIHFLSLLVPLVGSVLITYLLVAVGIMDTYHLYPATSKDAAIYTPIWSAVIIWILGPGFLFWLCRKLSAKYLAIFESPTQSQIKQFGFFMSGLGSIYLLIINPFSLIFILPVFVWSLIKGRKETGKYLDILFFAIGGLFIYVLIYFFGFVIMKNNLAILWYLMMMFSIGMVSFPTSIMIMAIIASGLGMIVLPQKICR